MSRTLGQTPALRTSSNNIRNGKKNNIFNHHLRILNCFNTLHFFLSQPIGFTLVCSAFGLVFLLYIDYNTVHQVQDQRKFKGFVDIVLSKKIVNSQIRIQIARDHWHFWDIRRIFLPNKGEAQKGSYNPSAEAPGTRAANSIDFYSSSSLSSNSAYFSKSEFKFEF